MPVTILSLLGRFWYIPVIAILTLATHHYRSALLSSEAELTTFRAEVKVLGEQAERQAKQKEVEYAKSLQTAVAGRAAALDSLRKSLSSSSSHVPLTPSVAQGDTSICFEPSAFAAAVERYRGRVQGVVGQGEEAAIDARGLLEGWPR